jgi:16S rRNA (guanine966-N2)-methyltransferase
MDRAREGLFDWLGPRVKGARVLDLFAGSGALGIEALSRGAREGVFVERARAALRVLRRNLEELELSNEANVLASDVARGLRALGSDPTGFDLVFADPPYGSDWLERLAVDANLLNLLSPAGLFIAERSKREAAAKPVPQLKLRDSRCYGETAFDWYEKSGDSGE